MCLWTPPQAAASALGALPTHDTAGALVQHRPLQMGLLQNAERLYELMKAVSLPALASGAQNAQLPAW